MSEVLESGEEPRLAPSGPILLDGLPTRAPVVVTLQAGEAVVWLVDLVGEPCGAWVLPATVPEEARRVLALCEGRALIAVEPESPIDHMLELAKIAGVDIPRSRLDDRLCSVARLLADTAEARAAHTEAVRSLEQRDNKRLAPMAYARHVPSPMPNSIRELVEAAGVVVKAEPRTEPALQMVYLARWAVRLWVDTESVRSRRSYLRDQFGPAQPLPGSWRQAITGAFRESLASPFAGGGAHGHSPGRSEAGE